MNDDTNQRAREIAGKLTKAQRATIIWMSEFGSWCRPDPRPAKVLRRLGLVESLEGRGFTFDRLNGDGRAVRRALDSLITGGGERG